MLRGVDSTFTKKLTGHNAVNVDEDVYTHISIGDLYKIVNDAFEEDMKYVGVRRKNQIVYYPSKM